MPKPDSAAASKLMSAWRETAVRRHTPLRPSSRPWGTVPRQTALAPEHAGWTHGGFSPARCRAAPPLVVADSWFGYSKLMRHVATIHQGTFLVEGKSTYVFDLPDGWQVKGYDLQQQGDWLWRHSEQVSGVRYARLRATNPTYGAVTLLVISEPREEQFYVMCLETAISGPRLIRAWKRRHWIEHCFRTLKHLLATGACQVHNEDAYYGHLVFSLKHYWRFVDSEALELKVLSQRVAEKAA